MASPIIPIPNTVELWLHAIAFAAAFAALFLTFKTFSLAKTLKKRIREGRSARDAAVKQLSTIIWASIGCALTVAACRMVGGDIWGTVAWAAFALLQNVNLEKTKIQ